MRGHPLLRDQFPDCQFCFEPATRWRISGSPPWGQDPSFNSIEETLAYRLWEFDGAPDGTYGACDAHFYHTLDDQGNTVLTAAGLRLQRAELRAQQQRPRAEVRREQRTRLRMMLIDKLGSQCETCGETDPALLRIRWPFRTRPEGLEGKHNEEWYSWLLDNLPQLSKCRLLCLAESVSLADDHKQAAIAAYGGKCRCGVKTPLHVVPLPGTAVPKYPGGRKLGSRDKYRWLVRSGFPSGWVVVCPAHLRG